MLQGMPSGMMVLRWHTSMLTWILRQDDRDPSYMIGAMCHNLESNAYVGAGPWVAEVDGVGRLVRRARVYACSPLPSPPSPPGQGGAHVLMAGISVTRPVMKAMQAVKLVRKMADDAPRSALLSVFPTARHAFASALI